jgi:MFS family permease
MALCVALGFGIVVPVLPTFAASFGVSTFAASAVVAAFALARLAFSPAVGKLGDRLGERNVVVAGLAIVAVSSAAAGMAGSYPQLLILRGLGGIGSAMFSVAAMSLLLGSVAPEVRGRATAFYHGGFLVGGVAGPAAGGVFSAISLRAPFFVYAGTLAVAAVVASTLPRRAAAAATRDQGTTRPLIDVLRDRRFRAACFSNICHGWNSQGVRSALVPMFVATTLYSDPQVAARWTGLAMAVSAGAQALVLYPAGSLTDRWGRRGPMILGAAMAGAAMAAIPFTSTMAALTAVLVLYALASALVGTAPAALVGDVAGPGGTRAVAVFSMSSDVGAIVGPLVAGFLADHLSYTAAFGIGAVWWIASMVLSTRIPGQSAGTVDSQR